ncbi:unnamed protein product [Gongylonema pulchrum]|uniref:DUF6570 domain-containing protein n=1 Tax=Gongylonema pulchrum TaxID=637853 RepID=A0A183DXC1_9BILA|nr:unnamed protein product [Gongylonema pulchrum]
MRVRRERDAAYNENQRRLNVEAMRYRRQTDEEYREQERITNAEAMRYRRDTDEEYREQERITNAEAMRYRRDTDEQYRENERLAHTEAMRSRRNTDEEYRENERIANAEAMRSRRNTDEGYRENERLANAEAMRYRRDAEEEYRENERIANAQAMRYRRGTDEEYRENERLANAEAMQNRRTNTDARNDERTRDREARQRQRSNYAAALITYENAIKEGPTYVCNCCGRLEFKRSITTLQLSELQRASSGNEAKMILLENVFYLQKTDQAFFCRTCAQSIKAWKQPRYCLANGLAFPTVHPTVRDLNRVEERLVAARHIFQTIWPSNGPTGQFRCRGGIVNIPVSVDTTVSLLPRAATDTHVVHVRIARRMEYRGNYISGNVRPRRVWEAALYLCQQSLYRSHNIDISDNWLIRYDRNEPRLADPNIEAEEDEEDADDAEPLNPGVQETMLLEEESQHGIRMAPGETQRPISILLDEDTEYLSFPTIFGGEKLHPLFCGRPMSYSDTAKSFAMRYDRRVANRPDYLLFMAKKIELMKLSSNMAICLRKKKVRDRTDINAANLINNDFLHGLVRHDDAFRVLEGVRNSCTHWHNEKLKVLAMVRQFGLPTFFLTLVTSLCGLYIIGEFKTPRQSQPNDPLQIELRRQEQCLLQPTFQFLRTERSGVQVIYHNVQSLAKHRVQIENDAVYTASDVILLGETWSVAADDIHINGYRTAVRADGIGPARIARGACCLVSELMMNNVRDTVSIRIGGREDCLDATLIKLHNVLIAGVYASPGVTIANIRSFLARCSEEEGRKLILGDFNHNITETGNPRFKEMMQEFGLKIWNVNVPTTNANSTLDLIISNFDISHGMYISLTSFHEPIWARYNP